MVLIRHKHYSSQLCLKSLYHEWHHILFISEDCHVSFFASPALWTQQNMKSKDLPVGIGCSRVWDFLPRSFLPQFGGKDRRWLSLNRVIGQKSWGGTVIMNWELVGSPQIWVLQDFCPYKSQLQGMDFPPSCQVVFSAILVSTRSASYLGI